MSRMNPDMSFLLNRKRSIRPVILLGLFCIVLVIFEASFVFKIGLSSVPRQRLYSKSYGFLNSNRFVMMKSEERLEEKEAPLRHLDIPPRSRAHRKIEELAKTQLSGLNFTAGIAPSKRKYGIFKSANDALEQGRKLWQELELNEKNRSNGGFSRISSLDSNSINEVEKCPHWILVSGDEFAKNGKEILMPCGLTLGSHITVVGKPRGAHVETKPKPLMISQFMFELQGLVEGEEPPRILHFNPRLKGDWSGKPVIVHNTRYRMKWGTPQRCEGWESRADEETVDGYVKCEKWIRNDDKGSEQSKATSWLNRLLGLTKKMAIEWPFPFAEEKFFVLTLRAGLEGYHVNVDGRHVSLFPYRTGFSLEDAARIFLNGDVDVLSIFVGSLPTSHPGKHLDLSNRWKAPPIPDGPVEMFVGVLSAGNHFAERMAVRKSWMQHDLIKSSNVVARFFVALHARKEVTEEVKKEAEFFGDIVIVPYRDHYDLVVLKTLAICEYGVRTVSANYIMKCDDDTFVRVDAIVDEAKKVQDKRSFYIGKLNYNHKPVRTGGKWGVTPEEWPEEDFPPYASGPGYVISSDIANFIVSNFEKHELRLFKLEDVCMGMWVDKFNNLRPVEHVHSLKFCPYGCIEDYLSAHYQSPGQMICLWNNLRLQGKPLCCNM